MIRIYRTSGLRASVPLNSLRELRSPALRRLFRPSLLFLCGRCCCCWRCRCALCSVGVLICSTPLSLWCCASLLLRAASPALSVGVAVVPSSACESPTAPAAVALLLWQSGQGALCCVSLVRNKKGRLFPRASPPVASGGLRWPPVASGGLAGRPRSLGACLAGVGCWVIPGWGWFGLWRDRSSEARLCT